MLNPLNPFMKQLLLSILMMLLPLLANADAVEINGIYYNLSTNTNTAEVTHHPYDLGYYSGDIVIPETVNYEGISYSVTSIGWEAFFRCSGLTSITIPNSVTSIGYYAFSGCIGLTSITIPNSITTIGKHAFYDCSSLTDVSLSEGLISIGEEAFHTCAISTISLPQSLIRIGEQAFEQCRQLTSITLPKNVAYLGNADYIDSYGEMQEEDDLYGDVFNGCDLLADVKVDELNQAYTSVEGLLMTKDMKTLLYIPGAKTEVVVPEGTETIHSGASSSDNLTTITLPKSLRSIEEGGFEYSNGVTSITSKMEVPATLGNHNFSYKVYNNATLYVPIGTKSKYEATDGWKDFKNIVEMGSNSPIDFADATVKAICVEHWDTNGDGMLSYDEAAAVTDLGSAFSYNKEITSFDELKYFTGLKSIGEYAFYGCKGITSITIPNSVTSIGEGAFSYCSGLASIFIPNSVTSIGRYAFAGCSGLTSVTIPESVISIGDRAFEGTAWYDNQPDGLVYAGKVAYQYKGTMPDNTSITLKEGTLVVADGAFNGCSGLASIFIPNSVKSIGGHAFDGCSNIKTIKVENGNTIYDSRNDCNAIIRTADNELIIGCSNTVIPNSVISIGPFAFAGCSGLTSLIIPNSVTSIGSSAFEDCSSLTSITIPDGVTTIGSYAFKDCSGLTSLTFPNSLTTIEHHAFYGDSVLTSLVIPNSVTTIEECAFLGCSGLTSLTISNNLTSIENAVFFSCRNLISVTIPNSVISIKSSAFAFCSGLTSITIPNSVTSIGWEAFKECSSLASVTIPNSVTSISYHAFYHCSSLTSVIIGNGLMSLDRAFESCNSLSSIQVASDNTYYDSREGCNAIIETSTNKLVFGCKTTVIPNSVTSIGSSAFEDCSGLTSITIPNSVTSIGEWAFIGCSSLTSVTSLIEEPFAIDNYMFENYDNATLYVPIGTKSKYETTDGWKRFKNIVEMDLLPVDNGQTIDFGTDIDENTNLNGNIMDNVFVNVNNGDGSYDPSEGCIIVSKPTDDSAIDGKEIFGEDFKDNYTGIVFKLAPGEGTIKVEAQTTGNMVLKVKIGDGMPITMELESKLKVSFPYNVSEDTYVYIYGGLNTSNNAKGMRRAEPADGTLKIYGIEVDSKANDIESLEVSQDDIATIYNLNGHRINSLQRGVNIIRMNDGTVRKVVVK